MAVYEFECPDCSKRFEVNVSIKEHDRLKQDRPACPGCGEKNTRQLASIFSCRAPSSF